MPTVSLTAFDSATANGYGNGPAFEWDTVAAGWGSSPNGDTGAHPQTGSVSPLFAILDGLLTDDGTTIPADAFISAATVTFDWTLTPASPAQLWFPGGTHIASPGASGSASELFLTDVTRADLYAQSFGWTVSTSGDASPHNLRIQISNYAVSVTYTTPRPAPEITLNALDARTRLGLTIHDVLNDAPNTCNLTVETDTTSPLGKSIRIATQTATPVLLFNGAIQTVELSYDGKDHLLRWDCTATDDLAKFNRRRPFGTWTATSASDVAAALLAAYAPSFDGAGIEAALPTVSVSYDGSMTLAAAFAQMAQLIGGSFKTEDGVVFLFLTPIADPPDDIDDTAGRFLEEPRITMTVDLSQIRTRVYVHGAGSAATGESAVIPPAFNLTTSPTTGGSMVDGLYSYGITAVSATGESQSGGAIGATVAGADNAVLIGNLDATLSADDRCTGRKLYRTLGPGNYHGLIATLGNDAATDPNTFLDTVEGSLLDQASIPLVETTANIFTMVEDTVAQAALATLEGGGSDGIVEHYVLDQSLTTTARATARGEAELALFAYPLVTVRYATRDVKSKSGQTVHFDLTTPPITGDLLIQDVTISGLDKIGGPIFLVTASSVRFSLEAILRMALAGAA